jgi:hypothetical protein
MVYPGLDPKLPQGIRPSQVLFMKPIPYDPYMGDGEGDGLVFCVRKDCKDLPQSIQRRH